MPSPLPLSIASPGPLLAAGALLLVLMIIAVVRRLALARASRLLLAMGLVLLTLAAGEPRWWRVAASSAVVMVDLSPSTRGATFRKRDALIARVHQLLGDTPYRIEAFADGAARPLPNDATLADIPADRTTFIPPTADAVLLFSDGRFEPPPALPPTCVVVDPALEHPADAAVVKLEQRDANVLAELRNDGPPRALTWSNATAASNDPVGGDVRRLATPTGASADISASLNAGDLWPENDSLSIRLPPPRQLERWWVSGGREPGAGWRTMSPAELPVDAMAYLSAAAIVLDDVPTDALSSVQQDRLLQSARDLGGGVVILGGEHAFAAGGYDGTPIDALSPLASSPPGPSENWIVLIDGSGSMAAGAGGGASPWQAEETAVSRALPAIPPNDSINVGSFAGTITWASRGRRAVDTKAEFTDEPRGPTNLRAALQAATDSAAGDAPTELLIMTDGEAELSDADALAALMKQRRVRLHLLAIGNGSALPALKSIVTATGGTVVEQSDAAQWPAAARQLVRQASPSRLVRESSPVRFLDDLQSLGERTAPTWNRTWLKSGATLLAAGPANTPMAARWQIGAGKSAAIAYAADVADVVRIADSVAAAPRDLRFNIHWRSVPALDVTVDAVDGGAYLNSRRLTLELLDPASPDRPMSLVISQVGPGRYELHAPPPRSAVIAAVRDAQAGSLSRFAVAGRYAAEFDAIGNDHGRMADIAERSGGAVIEPADTAALPFIHHRQETSLTAWLATAGAAAIAVGLIRWRNG